VNEQLQAKLVEILSAIQAGAKATGDFAMEQLPDIAQQYIAYGRVTSLMHLAVALLVLWVGLYLLNSVRRHISAHGDVDGSDPGVVAGGGTLAVIATIIGGIATMNTATGAALVWMAPKVWLIKELASLVK
jgi:hypothetical protein